MNYKYVDIDDPLELSSKVSVFSLWSSTLFTKRSRQTMDSHSQPSTTPSNYFDGTFSDEDSDNGMTQAQDELEHYLATEHDRNVDNAIEWWIDHRSTYPRLSRMARDFLTIPGVLYSHIGYYTKHSCLNSVLGCS